MAHRGQPGLGSYTYDAENRMKTTAGVTYTYDGDGRRVQKSNGKLYWYGAGSSVMMETDLSGNLQDEYIFFNGQRTARRTSAGVVYYFFSDHLGTNRIVTNATGGVVEDSDFYPFGGERTVVDTLNNQYKFTGHERDGESGLDYMVARHYAFTLGRFLQPDAPFADQSPSNPQTWNLYSYARNNPLYFVDPTGQAGSPWSGPMGQKLPSRGDWALFGAADDGSPKMDYGWGDSSYLETYSSVNSDSDQNTTTSGTLQGTVQDEANNRTGYDTADEAASAALAKINPKSIKKNREYGGRIYRDSAGRYHYTKAKKGGAGVVNVHKAKVPKGATVVGDYHTHGDYSVQGPGGKIIRTSDPARDSFNSDHFSPDDRRAITQDARGQSGYRGYLGTPSGRFLFYDPATRQEGVLQ